MDKIMHAGEETSMANNATNQKPGTELYVRRVASSGLVLKFKVDKYGTLPSEYTSSSQEVTMWSEKQNVRDLDNFEDKMCSPGAIPLLQQSDISTPQTRMNQISIVDNAKVARPDERINTAAISMMDKCTMVEDQIIPSGSTAVDSTNGVCIMDGTISSKKPKMELLVTENGGSNYGSVVHTCHQCGKSFKEVSSLNGHMGSHWREDYKRMRMVLEHTSTVEASQVMSPPISPVKKKRELKKIWLASLALEMMLTESGRHPEHTSRADLSASLTYSNNQCSGEATEMGEVVEILATLAQKVCNDTVHVPSASTCESFVCSTCKKTFSSYHALRGHMSCHNPPKKTLLEDGTSSSKGSGKRSTWKFVCSKCNERFPSGQSLGGHKRKHFFEKNKITLPDNGNVKPPLPLAHGNMQPTETALVVAAQVLPPAYDAFQQPQQTTNRGKEIELPQPSVVSEMSQETAVDMPAGPITNANPC